MMFICRAAGRKVTVAAATFAFLGMALPGLLACAAPERKVVNERPTDFVDAQTLSPSLRVEMMYYGAENFVGRPIEGYRENRCLLVRPAAEALARAQSRLESIGRREQKRYTLLVRDCYRPQKAVDDFLAWVADPADLKQKDRYYPTLAKPEIVSKGYLATFSGHSRGSTVDLTVAEILPDGSVRPLNMGAILDFFGEVSHTAAKVGPEARRGRALLLKVMLPEFENYKKEWWHYTLREEPYPHTAFDFDVEERRP